MLPEPGPEIYWLHCHNTMHARHTCERESLAWTAARFSSIKMRNLKMYIPDLKKVLMVATYNGVGITYYKQFIQHVPRAISNQSAF